MENPLIQIAAKFQYKIPSMRTLAVMDTISWSRCRPHRNSCTFLQRPWSRKDAVDVSTFLRPHLRNWCWKPFSGMLLLKLLLLLLLVLLLHVVSCCRRWWYLSSDHIFQVYYKVRKVLLLSATALLLQSATGITKCDNFIIKCNRTTSGENAPSLKFIILANTCSSPR